MIQDDVFAGAPRRHEGFGPWTGAHIVPHFDQIPAAVISAMRLAVGKKRTLIGVNADSALLAIEGTYRAIRDRVTIWTITHRTEFGPGDVPSDALHNRAIRRSDGNADRSITASAVQDGV